MKQAFLIFDIIHKVLVKLENIKKVVKEVMEDFASNNCIYLELRTTPKYLINEYTMEEYLITICEEILEFSIKN